MNEESILRGTRAAQLLADPLLTEAFDGLERGAVERLANCDANDAKTLQSLTLALQTVRAVRRRFTVWVAEGKDEAERQIKREMQPPGVLSRFRRAA